MKSMRMPRKEQRGKFCKREDMLYALLFFSSFKWIGHRDYLQENIWLEKLEKIDSRKEGDRVMLYISGKRMLGLKICFSLEVKLVEPKM